MNDAISRSAVLEEARPLSSFNIAHLCIDQIMVVDVDDIENLPALDAAPVVHARWIYYGDVDEDGNCEAECSECFAGDKHRKDLMNAVPYCWSCGARMDAEEG